MIISLHFKSQMYYLDKQILYSSFKWQVCAVSLFHALDLSLRLQSFVNLSTLSTFLFGHTVVTQSSPIKCF